LSTYNMVRMIIHELADSIISLCPDGIIGIDRHGMVAIFNEAAAQMSGWSCEQAIGKLHISEIWGTEEAARDIKKAMYGHEYGGAGRLDGYEAVATMKSGKKVPLRVSAVLLYQDGEEVGSVGFFHDLTQRKQLEDELLRLSITDSLTGLFNRRHFYKCLSEELTRCERYERPLTLVYIDLDCFKPFNDTFGHQEGDNILTLVSQCAEEALRAQDCAFRQGGDEFALLLVETNLENGIHAANRFRNAFNKRWPTVMAHLAGTIAPVTLSLGVVQYQQGESMDSLVKRADLAMYRAKDDGGDCVMTADVC